MTKVRDIMTTELVTVTPEVDLRDLVDLLGREHIGGAPVVREDRIVGVVTANDVLSFLASEPVVPTEQPDQLELDEAYPVDAWKEGEESDAAFFVDTWDDAGADTTERFRSLEGPEWDMLGEHTVEEAMSRQVFTIAPTEELTVAARRLQKAHIHRLLVTSGDALVGIISTSDITRAVAEGKV
jgi:CBS domain-containing protein